MSRMCSADMAPAVEAGRRSPTQDAAMVESSPFSVLFAEAARHGFPYEEKCVHRT